MGKKRLDYKKVKEYIEEEVSDWYSLELISDSYKNYQEKLAVQDDKGYKYYVSFGNIKKYYKEKGNLLRFAPRNPFSLYNITLWLQFNKPNYKLLSKDFNNNMQKLKFECDKGHSFEMRFGNMFNFDYNCPYCVGNAKYTIKEAVDMFNEKDFELVDDKYVNARTRMKFICRKHRDVGIQKVTLSKLIYNKFSCRECLAEHKRKLFSKTTKQFKKEVFDQVGDEYDVLGEYVTTHTPIEMKHNDCGHRWLSYPKAFLNQGCRCPKCSMSQGENRIKEFLNKNNINYDIQYKFDDCKNHKSLPFDFAIFNNDNELIFLIEYDGELHFEPARFSDDKDVMLEKLNKTQLNDKIKNQYCKKSNIALVRIPYWQYDRIEKILNKWLSKYL